MGERLGREPAPSRSRAQSRRALGVTAAQHTLPERTLASPDRRHDWRDDAACLGEDPELFFPTGSTGPALQQIEEAKAVCRTCLVIDTCLTWALETGQEHGVWGGLSEDERRAVKRRRARAQRA